MKKIITATAFGLAGLAGTSAMAETCGGTYVVQSGDSLSLIADGMYKDVGKWTAIHGANSSVIGPNPANLRVGMRLTLPCIAGFPAGLPDGEEVADIAETIVRPAAQVERASAAAPKQINLLTRDDYAPFVDKDIHKGGLANDIMTAVMDNAAPEEGYAVHWVDGWTSHLDPLLSNALLDVGFPWIEPDCETAPESYRCTDFTFSDPMFEMLMLLFTTNDSDLVFNKDEDILGKTICRPAGYSIIFLDSKGRNWFQDNLLTVVSPWSVEDCFERLLAGTADAVVLNEFTGRDSVKELGLSDQIKVMSHPIAIQQLGALVHNSHPQKDELIEMINSGIAGIKENGQYQEIVEDHLTRIWAAF